MRLSILLSILAITCGCLAHGSAHVEQLDPTSGAVISTTDVTYLRLGDQEISDFTMSADANGTKSIHLGGQKSDAAILKEVLTGILEKMGGI